MTDDEGKDLEERSVPAGVYVAAGMVGLLGLGVFGWMMLRSRRRQTLVRRLREVVPDTVRSLHDRVRRARRS